MDINITISDEQGAALAAAFKIQSYADGNDLLGQVSDAALLEYNRRSVIGRLSAESDPAVMDAVIAAFNSTAATPISQPPIKIKPTP